MQGWAQRTILSTAPSTGEILEVNVLALAVYTREATTRMAPVVAVVTWCTSRACPPIAFRPTAGCMPSKHAVRALTSAAMEPTPKALASE